MARWYDEFLESINHGWKRIVLKHFLGNLIPVFIPIFYTVPPVRECTKSFIKFLSEGLYDKMSPIGSQIAIIVFVYLIVPIVIEEINCHMKKRKDVVQEKYDRIKTLMACVSVVVEQKKQRFFDYCKSGSRDPQKVFGTITQPLVQMTAIVKSIQLFYKQAMLDDKIDCYLYDVQEGEVRSERTHTCIGDSQVDFRMVKDNRFVKACIQQKDVMIAPKLSPNPQKKESFNNSKLDLISSVICYPIRSGTKVDFVIVVASKNKAFEKNDRELYKYVLGEFSNRIGLEACLEKIKGGVINE